MQLQEIFSLYLLNLPHVTAYLCVNSQWDIVNLMLPSAAVAA